MGANAILRFNEIILPVANLVKSHGDVMRHTLILFGRTSFILLLAFCTIQPQLLLAENEGEPKKKTRHHVLWVMDIDGNNLKTLFTSARFTSMGSPAFSPDGSKIAMDGSEPKNGKGGHDTRILLINADGTGLKDLGDGAMPSWSADGKRFAFSRYSPNHGVWIMNTDGTKRELLDENGWGAQWSPDGKNIVYSVYANNEANLMLYDPHEETFSYLLPVGNHPFRQFYWNCCWSPDSKSICIKAATKQGKQELVTIEIERANKGIKVQYSHEEKIPSEDITWHPDGNLILCTILSEKEDTKQFYEIDPTQKQKPRLWKPGQKIEWPRDICWTPDGKKVIFTTPED